MARSATDLPEGTYVELVRSLFTTLIPATIMGMSFIAVGMLATARVSDPWLGWLVVLGGVASLARVGYCASLEPRANDPGLTVAAAVSVERWFGITYIAFAAILGLFGARILQVATPELHMLVTALIGGYCAGVAAGISLRPWISVSSVSAAIVPTVVVSATSPDVAYRMLAIVFAAMLAGGINSMMVRYHSELGKLAMRRTLATLARQDALTGLGNRLALAARFDALAACGEGQIAVHCLDLDRFKPVNDRYGHPAGDALLQAVAGRLSGVMRDGDFAARMGGDEFVLLQAGIRHPGEAEMMAHRIVRAIAEPFAVAGALVEIGTSLGFALSADHGPSLERLIAAADRKLYQVKANGGGVAPPSRPVSAPIHLLA